MSAVILLWVAGSLAPPDDFDTFFKEFSEKRTGIQLLEADIEERTFEFGEVNLRRGRVLFGKPRRIIFRYEGDEPTLMVDDRRVYEFDPLEEQLQIYDIDDSPEASIFFLGFDSDTTALREAYDVRLFSVDNDQGKDGIIIRPKKDRDNAPFQEVMIYLRDADYLPFRIQIKLDDDANMVTEFSNYKINQPVAPSFTQLRIPAETRIIENGDVTVRSVPAGGLLVPPAALTVPESLGSSVESDGSDNGEVAPEESVTVEVLPAP
ncbi:MAG: outer membrane lipoprotein carrier protein LolA [Candidatus Hydrogenedentes bacterium]|nr:outer membrane lipoprotein carrier protein LolA [Candidatus Hydrogenedentota bacterium]